jgi:hypothetical protein
MTTDRQPLAAYGDPEFAAKVIARIDEAFSAYPTREERIAAEGPTRDDLLRAARLRARRPLPRRSA